MATQFDHNPANDLKDFMWKAFMDLEQRFYPEGLEQACYTLIKATTQKTAGQRKDKADHVDWKELDMVLMDIAIEACSLVLSKDWPEIKERYKKENEE